jgi:hypothetical protein
MRKFYDLNEAERASLIEAARRRRVPLMALWETMEPELTRGWDFRRSLAANWLADAKVVADLGCGDMALERYLSPNQQYIPVDCVKRDQRTIVLDLNVSDFRTISADSCAVLGVAEYIYDLPGFLQRVAQSFPRVVASFVCRIERHREAARQSMGWVNHFDHRGICDLCAAAGLVIEREQPIGPPDTPWNGQYLFAMVSAGSG